MLNIILMSSTLGTDEVEMLIYVAKKCVWQISNQMFEFWQLTSKWPMTNWNSWTLDSLTQTWTLCRHTVQWLDCVGYMNNGESENLHFQMQKD